MPIANVLKYLRTKFRYDQTTVAGMLDMQRSTYGKYESNSSTPTIKRIMQLAEIFEVSTDFLIYGYDTAEFVNVCKSIELANFRTKDIDNENNMHEVNYFSFKFGTSEFNLQPSIEDIQHLFNCINIKFGELGTGSAYYPLYYFFEICGHLDIAAYLISKHKDYTHENEHFDISEIKNKAAAHLGLDTDTYSGPLVIYSADSFDASVSKYRTYGSLEIDHILPKSVLNKTHDYNNMIIVKNDDNNRKPTAAHSVKDLSEEEKDELLNYVDMLLEKRRNRDDD